MAKPPPLFEDELPRRGGSGRQGGGRTSRGPRHWQGTPAQRLRVVLGYNQAVMKITSYGSGRNAVYDQLTYISRDGELALETERGALVQGQDFLPSILDEWEGSFDARVRSRDTMHMVMSAPAGTDETRFMTPAGSLHRKPSATITATYWRSIRTRSIRTSIC